MNHRPATLLVICGGATLALTLLITLDSFLWQPPNFPSHERVAAIFTARNSDAVVRTMPAGTFFHLRERSTSFELLSASVRDSVTLLREGRPQSVEAQIVSAGHASLFGWRALLGRTFTADDERPGHDGVVLLSESFWKTQFAGSPNVLGTKLVINGQGHRVVGVIATGAYGSTSVSLWQPLGATDARRGDFTYGFYRVHGRLKAGVALNAAQAEIEGLALQLAREQPAQVRTWRPILKSWRADYRTPVEPLLGPIIAASLGAIVLSALNATSLLLSRFMRDHRNIAVRFALGATPWQVIRPYLTEILMLCGVGSAIGLGLAFAVHIVIERVEPEWFVTLAAPEFSWRAAGLAAAIALTVALPMVAELTRRLRSANWSEALRQGTMPDRRLVTLLRWLNAAQIAASFGLALQAGLLVHTWQEIVRQPIGFDPSRLQFAFFRPNPARYDTAAKQAQFADDVAAAARRIAGVESVGVTTTLPLAPFLSVAVAWPGQQVKSWAELPRVAYAAVSVDYFATAGVRVLQGRPFTGADHANAPRVAIINSTLARQHFGDRDPVGQWLMPPLPPQKWRQIVGVVEDVLQENVTHRPVAQLYEPFSQAPVAVVGLVIRHAKNTAAPTALALQSAVASVDPTQAAGTLQSFPALINRQTAKQRFAALSVSLVSAFALALATLGVAAIMNLTTTQRTREFGVRLALGATPRTVLTLVLGESLRLIALGLAAGWFLGWALESTTRALLPDAPRAHLPTALATGSVVAACAILATLWPALRASRVDPVLSLRQE